MPSSDDIKMLLSIQDDCIEISNVKAVTQKGVQVNMVYGVLSREAIDCPCCKEPANVNNQMMIVKNGTKVSSILMNRSSLFKTVLKLSKQRFHCKHCGGNFTCQTNVVDRHCFISKQVKFSILESLSVKQSASAISKKHFVSWSTVQRVIASLHPYLKRNKKWLPSCLMVDEFRSMKNIEGKMSFICADGDTGELFDILPTRRLDYISSHFSSFSYEARKQVKYVVTDMNAPYFELTKKCFPKAAVIVDRFHIVQHINRAFNSVRIRTMKSINQNDPNQAKQYRQLKSLYKLLLKNPCDIDHTTYAKWRNFKGTFLTEIDVVNRLLAISDELASAYSYFQKLLAHFRNKEPDDFFNLIKNTPAELPNEMKRINHTFVKYEKGIRLAMKLQYSNGKIENKNTHIKTLKRVCYGFKSFQNMKARIFLLNNLIA